MGEHVGAGMGPDELRGRLLGVLDAEQPPPAHPDARLAGVLVPIVATPEPTLLLTRRADHLPRHAGEISFPGGGADPADDGDLRTTALREFEEELGVPASTVEVLGALPAFHVVVSGFSMVPFVGWLREMPTLRPDAAEVSEVLAVPFVDLGRTERPLRYERAGQVWEGFAFDAGEHVVWGATGFVLHGLFGSLGLERV